MAREEDTGARRGDELKARASNWARALGDTTKRLGARPARRRLRPRWDAARRRGDRFDAERRRGNSQGRGRTKRDRVRRRAALDSQPARKKIGRATQATAPSRRSRTRSTRPRTRCYRKTSVSRRTTAATRSRTRASRTRWKP